MNTLDLSPFFQTKAQSTDFSTRIATVTEKIYETDFNLEQILLEQFGLKKKDAFMVLLRDNNVPVDHNSNLQTFLKEIQQTITTLPILTITTAFEPKEQILKTLSEWFVLNLRRQLLFEVIVDRSLIAGAAISFNGRDMDFSVRTKFDNILKDCLAQTAVKAQPVSNPDHQNL